MNTQYETSNSLASVLHVSTNKKWWDYITPWVATLEQFVETKKGLMGWTAFSLYLHSVTG